MADPVADAKALDLELSRLSIPGLLGFYTQFEVTEIVGFPEKGKQPVNVFSLCVAEDIIEEPLKSEFLSPNRIRLKGLKEWAFGVARYSVPIATCLEAVKLLPQKQEWALSGKAIRLGSLSASVPQFVPPDSAAEIPLNNVLKNNFWAGSHIFEWFDREKSTFQPFFQNSRLLLELSEEIQKVIPLRLGSLSDRLGSVVVQLPVTVVTVGCKNLADWGGYDVELAWHPKATSRPLRVTCETGFDGLISGYISSCIEEPGKSLTVRRGAGLHEVVIWDDLNRVILAATGPMSPASSIRMNTQIQSSEARRFILGEPGQEKQQRVLLAANSNLMLGTSNAVSDGGWTVKRLYRTEALRLASERRFVQYLPVPGQQNAENEKALGDLRLLIDAFGADGAWLWDPYLDANDILETLFFCKHVNADLRALTALGETPQVHLENSSAKEAKSVLKKFSLKAFFRDPFGYFSNRVSAPTRTELSIGRARDIFQAKSGNREGLRLEFRGKTGSDGWSFHDRFLIFPATSRGALAWSLGTSVNNLGKQHHILQMVSDGQLVADAFNSLWESLNKPENLVWKTP